MKKIFLIAALSILVATIAQAQHQVKPMEPLNKQEIVNPTVVKVSINNEDRFKSLSDDNNTQQSSKSKLEESLRSQRQRVLDNQVPEAPTVPTFDPNYYSGASYYAFYRLQEAQSLMSKFESKLSELSRKYAHDKEKLKKKYAESLAQGQDLEKYRHELEKLDEKYARQVAKAQKNLGHATNEYNSAVEDVWRYAIW